MVLSISVLIANLPQLWIAYKESDLTDLSQGTWLISTVEGMTWLTYAILRQDMAIMVSAFFQTMTSGLIIVLKLTRQEKNQTMKDRESG